jgi:hypothetical protein
MYSHTLSLHRHWMEVSDELHVRAALPLGKEHPIPFE